MANEIVATIKEQIEYTEKQNTCDGCKFGKEVEDSYVDRMWHWKCTHFEPLATLPVNPKGRCKHHEPKTTPTS